MKMHRLFALITGALVGTALLASSSTVRASVFEVGPSMHYTSLGTVPWAQLAPGDTVRVHWKAEPYREFILLSQSGTAGHHIVVTGVADPVTGKLPVVDGENAVQSTAFHYHDESSG